MSTTLFDKVWDSHVINKISNGPDVLFIDRHLIHEVTSPVAFIGLKNRGIKVMYPEKTFATADHNTPTINQHLPVLDALSANQLKVLEHNSNEHGILYLFTIHTKFSLYPLYLLKKQLEYHFPYRLHDYLNIAFF